MKTVLILAFSALSRDPRVRRQIDALRATCRIVAAGFDDPQIDGVSFVPIVPLAKNRMGQIVSVLQLATRQYDTYYWRQHHVLDSWARLAPIAADLIIANDIDTLPLALRLAQGHGARVLFDAHEYAPRQFEDRMLWRVQRQGFLASLCQRYIPRVDAMTTVCQGIADQYERDTGVKPTVILNAPEYADLEPILRPEHEPSIRMIHHGAAIVSRRIERMIETMSYLDERFMLDMLLVQTDPSYLETLRRNASRLAHVRILPPVPFNELIPFSHAYDIGLFLLEPVNFNYRHALPNKFFEFIQARLALAIGPSVEMARIVREHNCGVVAEDFSPRSMAQCLMQLDHATINHYKRQVHAIAEQMSSRATRATFGPLVDRLLADK